MNSLTKETLKQAFRTNTHTVEQLSLKYNITEKNVMKIIQGKAKTKVITSAVFSVVKPTIKKDVKHTDDIEVDVTHLYIPNMDVTQEPVKRKRGRPRKIVAEVEKKKEKKVVTTTDGLSKMQLAGIASHRTRKINKLVKQGMSKEQAILEVDGGLNIQKIVDKVITNAVNKEVTTEVVKPRKPVKMSLEAFKANSVAIKQNIFAEEDKLESTVSIKKRSLIDIEYDMEKIRSMACDAINKIRYDTEKLITKIREYQKYNHD